MVTVIGDDNKLNLVGDRTTLEFQISEASPEVLVDDINLFFNNGVDVTEITAVFSSNTVRYDIIGIENGDEGNYTLVANNPAGSSEATVVLEVQGIVNLVFPNHYHSVLVDFSMCMLTAWNA